MKILFHHRTASKDGQNVHIEELTGALRRGGHEVVAVGPGVSGDADFGAGGGFVDALKQRLPKALYELLELAYTLVAYRRLKRAYLQHRPDVLYERYNLFLLTAPLLKRRFGVPVLLEVNAPLAHERSAFGGLALKRLADWSERRAWRSADYVLPVTDKLADFVREAGVAETRIRVVQNGIDRRRFPLGLDGGETRRRLGLEDKLVLGFTGFIRDWHGLHHVVDALAEPRDGPPLHFLVVGDGPARPALEARARELGIADRLTILGVVGRDDVASYIASFDIALQPRVVAYASPLKLFEYMALGRAIVAPDQDNIREILTDGEDALLFTPEDGQAFRAAITRLVDDALLRDRLGQAAARLIEARGYSWDGNAERVAELARELVGKD